MKWKVLLGTNALTYFEKAQFTTVKSFITLAQGLKLAKLFSWSLKAGDNKLECFSLFSLVLEVKD